MRNCHYRIVADGGSGRRHCRGSRLMNPPAEAQTAATTSFSDVPGAIGEQDVSGPYEVQGWPKDLATLPGHDKWTHGSAAASSPRA
jgi:hypothetical protein